MRQHLLVLTVLICAACGRDANEPSLNFSPSAHADAERWSKQDNPKLFGQPLNYTLRELPLSGDVERMPWIGSYWPVARDSINFRWDGRRSLSAAEKYGYAFGGGSSIENAVSRNNGVDSVSSGGTCSVDSDCPGPAGVNYCGVRHGSGIGKCIPGWWGICDAWAAASILTPEPQRAVTRNGVEFRIPDIKALVTLVHKSTTAKHVALRCFSNGVNVDGANRPLDPACRDANPGTYHLLLANLLGRTQHSFIEDRSTDQDVWNHPVVSYKITRMQRVNERQANSLLGVGNERYPYNNDAAKLVYIENSVTVLKEDFHTLDGALDATKFMATDNYQYILELDDTGSIIGGEWVGDSKWKHPDFLWLPLSATGANAAGGAIKYADVMSIANESY